MRPVLIVLVVIFVTPAADAAVTIDELRELTDAGKFAEVVEASAALLAELEARGDTGSALYLEVLRRRADSLSRAGRSADPETVDLVSRMLALAERIALDAEEHSEVLRTAAGVSVRSGDIVGARDSLERALEIATNGLPEGHSATAQLQGNLSFVVRRLGDVERAASLGEQAVATCDKAPFRTCYTVYLSLAQTYRMQKRLDEAAIQYARALESAAGVLPADHPHIPSIRHGLTLIESERGRYDVARDSLEQVVVELKALLGDDHPRVAEPLFSLAHAYRLLGDVVRAESLLREAIAIREAKMEERADLIAYGYSELGSALTTLGRTGESCEAHRRALRIFEGQLDPDSGELAVQEMQVARCDAMEDRLGEANERIDRWTARYADPAASDARSAGYVWMTAGKLALERGRTDVATAAFANALEGLESKLGSDHPALSAPLIGLARARWRAGSPREALSAALRAESLVQRFDRGNLAGLTDAESLTFVNSLARTEWVPLSGLVHADGDGRAWLEASWEWIVGRRGMVFDNAALRRGMVRHAGELAEAWRRVVDTRERLAAQWVASGEDPEPERDRARMTAAIAEREAAERELAKMSRAFRMRVRDARVSLANVIDALPAGHALVEIVRAPVREIGSETGTLTDVALILLPDGAMRHAVLGRSEDVDAAVRSWRVELERSYGNRESLEAVWRTGDRLRRMIWDPIAERIGDAGTVLLVPEGALHQVVPGALPVARGEEFLAEVGPRVHLLGSARDVVRFASRGRSGFGLLAVADPRFGEETGRAQPVRDAVARCAPLSKGRKPLPASAVEVRRIRELFGDREPVQVLQGAGASETALYERASGRRILHLATHGYFVPSDCGGEDEASVPPLLRSGLLMSPGEGDDGVLTAEELAGWGLEGIDLVVLSACDTGLGDIALGEGVYGLRRAFELAGARTVVMSLWSIPDRQALKWTTAFYERLLDGTPSGDAAHQASLRLLGELRDSGRDPHPWLWAGFVTAGDWR